MRIQHNIMAMSAYRNYTNNVSAMKKNLEKLSSGYKINRAGDDAAGLAISEKMRAQITGLETAQKNAKDGISLVQTAEGALTEVHDMLNRMVELASMSANGTYDNTTDRAQLQKEMDQLNSEINRIADSANFNGIKLLNGNMQAGFDNTQALADAVAKAQETLTAAQAEAAKTKHDDTTTTTTSEWDTTAIKGKLLTEMDATDNPQTVAGSKTILESDASAGGKPKFSIELDGLAHQIVNAGEDLALTVGGEDIKAADGSTITIPGDVGADKTAAELAALYDGAKVTIDGTAYTAAVDGTRITFEADADPAPGTIVNAHYDVEFAPVAKSNTANSVAAQYTIDLSGLSATAADSKIDGVAVSFNNDEATTASDFVTAYNAAAGKDYTASVNGNVITLTQKVAGKVDDADVPAVEGTFTDMTADAEMAEATKGADAGNDADAAVYTVNLTGGTEAGLDTAGATIDGVDITWNTANDDLQHTLEDFVATYNATAGKKFVASTDGSTVTLTARATGAVTTAPAVANMDDIVGDGSVGAITEMTEATKGVDGTADGTKGYINVGTVDININTVAKEDRLANTVLTLGADDFKKDGAQLTLGNQTFIIATTAEGKTAAQAAAAAANAAVAEANDGKTAADADYDNSVTKVLDLSDLNNTAADFLATATSRLTHEAADNEVFSVGQNSTAGKVTLQQLQSAKDDTDMSTMDKLAGHIGYKYESTTTTTGAEKTDEEKAADAQAVADAQAALDKALKAQETESVTGKSLTLQIGDTAEAFNQLKVDIKDMHAVSLGQEYDEDGNVTNEANLSTIRIDDQTKAANAIDVIKRAINQVSDVRGTLGATQNRLDHTINNLSVMTENIQDAESTIRDVDVAEEMMAYTKNNILIQSAQAMLAQANQVPQGVLQLLQ